MSIYKMFGIAAVIGLFLPALSPANQVSIPSLVVTIENSAPSRGALQTPFWVGIHDGTFDLYDRDIPLGADGLVDGEAVERLAEDGNTGPLSAQFSSFFPLSPQATLFGPSGPLSPGDKVSYTLNVNPEIDRYFSYASMVIPSNDAFIANGDPKAHEIFDEEGRFVARGFSVAGVDVLDAGTELNDEVAVNTAFLNQGGPDTGVPEDGVVVLHPGFRTDGLTYPDGVLNHPPLGLADFLAPDYRAAQFSFRYIDLGKSNLFRSRLSPGQEVTGVAVESDGRGSGLAISSKGNQVFVQVRFTGLTGPLVAAHLHNGAKGSNGPVVVDLSDRIRRGSIRANIGAGNVVGPLAESSDPILALLGEMAAGNIYINLHTAAHPAGEIRGQIKFQRTLKRDYDYDD